MGQCLDMCGTYAGFKRHKYYKTEICEPCLLAAREYNRKRYHKDIEKTRTRNKIYNKRRAASIKKYKEENKDRLKALAKVYREENKDHIAKMKKLWKQNNPESTRASVRKAMRRRKARIKNNITIPYTESQVLETYGTNCNICGTEIDLSAPRQCGKPGWQIGLHIDHLIPIAKDGPDTLENVRPTHALCNIKKWMN